MPSAERDELTIDGFTTSYLSAGKDDAPLVVLLHDGAWGGSAEASWAGVLPLLAEHYRILAPDLYGFGRSSKMVQLDVAPYEFRLRQLAALLDALSLRDRRAHVVGNSFGGAMALRAATSPWFAWRMRSAVSISGTGGPYRTRDSLVSLARFDGSEQDMLRIVRLITGDFPDIRAHVDLRMRDATNPAHYRAVKAAGLETPFASTAKVSDDYPASLGQVMLPIALVTGARDELVEPDWATRIAQHGPTCTVYEHAGRHAPNISDPIDTAELLLGILRDHESAGA